MEYGEWKTGLRNDGFQYAFISLGNKVGMAVGTALLAGLLGKYGYIANQTQNATVLSIMKHAFTTIPGASLALKKNIDNMEIPVNKAKRDAVLPLLFNLRNNG